MFDIGARSCVFDNDSDDEFEDGFEEQFGFEKVGVPSNQSGNGTRKYPLTCVVSFPYKVSKQFCFGFKQSFTVIFWHFRQLVMTN